MDERTRMLKEGHIPTVIVKLGLPAVAGLIIVALYNMADTFFVGLIQNGTDAQAAVSVTLPISMFNHAVAMWIAAGGASFLSRRLGSGNMDQTNRIATTTLALEFVVALFLTIVCLVFLRPLLSLFATGQNASELAVNYGFIIVLFGTIPQAVVAGLHNLLRGEGSVLRSMIGMMSGGLLNVALDPLFIFVFDMGVQGAAYATVLSQFISMLILFGNYLFKKTVVRPSFRLIAFPRKILAEIFRCGLPTFANQLLASISLALISYTAGIAAIVSGGDPTGAISAFGIVQRVSTISSNVMFGLAQGFQPVAGYNYGAGQFDRLKHAMRFSIALELGVGGVFLACGSLFSAQIISWFNSDAYVIQVGAKALIMVALACPCAAFSQLMTSVYQSMGRATGALIISICRQGVFLIPLLFLLANTIGLTGVMIAPLAADLATMIISVCLAVNIYRHISPKTTPFENVVH